MSQIEDLLSRPVAVLGGGVTGKAIVEFLHKRGAEFSLFDERADSVAGMTAHSAIENPELFGMAIVSPGWRANHEMILQLSRAGVRIISELDLAWLVKEEIAPQQKWIALTGTNGKTTTIQMVQSIMDAAGIHGRACGNVGEPAITAVTATPPYELLALELSSFQIDWSSAPTFEASAILNIAEDHIDWHGSFDAYANAKLKLLQSSNVAILNAEDSEVVLRSASYNGRKIFYSLETPAAGELGLVEEILVDRAFDANPSEASAIAELADITPQVPHNVSNALAAAGLALAVGITHESVKKGLSAFVLDHHRLELVHESNGVTWINDSKATNPHAAIAGILSHTSVIWIAGGLAKGAKMDVLVKRAAPRLKAAILIGTDRELIADALAKHAPHIPIYRIDLSTTAEKLMEDVVTKALEIASESDAVLLAPACASMDQFTSYAHRGRLFADAVQTLVIS